MIAERVNDDARARARMRQLFWSRGILRAEVRSGKEVAGAKYSDYFDWSEPIASAPSHRVLAIRRGEAEEILSSDLQPPEESALAILDALFVRGTSRSSDQVRLAVRDGYKRLLARAMETETRAEAKTPRRRGGHRRLCPEPAPAAAGPAARPETRAGDRSRPAHRLQDGRPGRQGQLVHDEVIYLDQSQQRTREAADAIARLVERFSIEAIAIGNGTGGRETETFIRGLDLPAAIAVVMVNESGASVYSASDVAREEFPDQDITVRGAVSIGRRLMDPLAELVKLDAKSIGVGQYQHDVDQDDLKHSLDDVVVSCVNAVGVEVNTASKQLLAYVSGLERQCGRKSRAVSQCQWSVQTAARFAGGATSGRQSVRAGGWILAHPRRRESARRIGRPSGVVRGRRPDGQRPGRHRARPDARRNAAPEDRSAALRE